MSKGELIFIICIILPVIPMALFGQWRLFWVFMSFYICFGLQEWLSVVQTGKTISQHFWDFQALSPVKANIIIGFMITMWTSLIMHFKSKKKEG